MEKFDNILVRVKNIGIVDSIRKVDSITIVVRPLSSFLTIRWLVFFPMYIIESE